MAIQLSALFLAILAWGVSFVQLRRSRRQNNEDILFSNKIEAYKQTLLSSYEFLQKSYFILEELPEFKGDKESWVNTKMPELFRLVNPMINTMDNQFLGYAMFLPDDFVKRYNEFSFKCQRLLVEHYHIDNEASSKTYSLLTEMHQDLVNAARKDLHIELLNEKLKYRLGD